MASMVSRSWGLGMLTGASTERVTWGERRAGGRERNERGELMGSFHKPQAGEARQARACPSAMSKRMWYPPPFCRTTRTAWRMIGPNEVGPAVRKGEAPRISAASARRPSQTLPGVRRGAGAASAGRGGPVRACEEEVRDDLAVAGEALLEAVRRLVAGEEREDPLVGRGGWGWGLGGVFGRRRVRERVRRGGRLRNGGECLRSWRESVRTVAEAVEGNELVVVEPLQRAADN